MVLLAAACVAAGSASADPPSWNGRWHGDRNDRYSGTAIERPTLEGTTVGSYRGERTMVVRSHDTTYRIVMRDADVRGAGRRGEIPHGVRVLIWGSLVEEHVLRATRVDVVGAGGAQDPYDRDDRYGAYHHNQERDRLVGRVEHVPAAFFGEREVTVAADGERWRVDVPKGTPVMRGYDGISVFELRAGEYVHIEGERTGDSQFRATRVDVETAAFPTPPAETLAQSTFAGSIGRVDRHSTAFTLRLNSFETYTVRTSRDTKVLRDGYYLRLDDLREGARVRVTGYLDKHTRTLDARFIQVL